MVSVLVDQGDAITAGQVLARLDDAQYVADVERGEATVRAAEFQLRDLLAGARPDEVEQLRARLASATATRTLAEREFERAQQLFRKELIAAQDVDRARQAYDAATAAQREAGHALELAPRNWARKDQIGPPPRNCRLRNPHSCSRARSVPIPSSRARWTATW